MVDLSDKVSESEDNSNMISSNNQIQTPERVLSDGTHLKTCADCGTTKTPLWRGGPAGPKSLCNACGIRSRKKRRALLGLNKDDKKPKKSSATITITTTSSSNNKNNNNSTTTNGNGNGSSRTSSNNSMSSSSGGDNHNHNNNSSSSRFGDFSMKRKLLTFGRDVALQRPRSSTSTSATTTSQRRKLGEEEQAAFLLMALSCGSVYA